VTRLQTSLVSAIAAVPAALLALMVVMVYLSYMEGLKSPLIHVFLVLTLVTAAAIALTPFALLVPPRKKRESVKMDTTESSATAVVDGEEVEVAVDEAEITDADDTEIAETVDFDSGQIKAEIEEFDAAQAEQQEDTEEVDDSAVFLDEDEEDTPRKKKR
jgi:hypothetical protein